MKLNKRIRFFERLIDKNNNRDDDLGVRLFIQSLGNQGIEFLKSYKIVTLRSAVVD